MAESRTAVMAALLGNAALAVMKSVAAVSTGSAAMVAETFHSVADTGNQVLLFLGLRLSERPPDRAHGFGHGRDVYFWAFVVSLMLFSLGGAFSIWEGVRKLLHGSPHEGSRWWSLRCWWARSFSSRARSSWPGAPSPRRGAARACAVSGVTTAIRRCPPSCSRTPPPSCLSASPPSGSGSAR